MLLILFRSKFSISYASTLKFDSATFHYCKIVRCRPRMHYFQVSGSLRQTWPQYYADSKAVVFLLDMTNRAQVNRLSSARSNNNRSSFLLHASTESFIHFRCV